MEHSAIPRTCPCKRLPLCLSSFTAAAYGDLHSLSKQGSALARRRDAAGYTPLHLSAQNGHVAATSLLLKLGCDVNGTKECGATPLHRAAFSGAVATMKLLIEWDSSSSSLSSTTTTKCDVLAVDTSFGDRMTPLHKATAGGRYLAVQLLIDTLRNLPSPAATRSPTVRLPIIAGSHISTQQSLLPAGLEARDSMGRTPLDIAIAYSKIQDEEQESVARWDEVAGCRADWFKCAQLLRAAKEEAVAAPTTVTQQVMMVDNDTNAAVSSSSPVRKKTQYKDKIIVQPLPAHLSRGLDACIDCEADNGGDCLTSSWEKAFQAALGKSVLHSLSVVKTTSWNKEKDEDLPSIGTRQQQPAIQVKDDDENSRVPRRLSSGGTLISTPVVGTGKPSESSSTGQVGPTCAQCARLCFALHSGNGGELVCKACKRKPKV